jgi:hypothetical protein
LMHNAHTHKSWFVLLGTDGFVLFNLMIWKFLALNWDFYFWYQISSFLNFCICCFFCFLFYVLYCEKDSSFDHTFQFYNNLLLFPFLNLFGFC